MQRPRPASHAHFRHSHISELICGLNSSIDGVLMRRQAMALDDADNVSCVHVHHERARAHYRLLWHAILNDGRCCICPNLRRTRIDVKTANVTATLNSLVVKNQRSLYRVSRTHRSPSACIRLRYSRVSAEKMTLNSNQLTVCVRSPTPLPKLRTYGGSKFPRVRKPQMRDDVRRVGEIGAAE